MAESYQKAGVDIEAGYEVVERIKKHIDRTKRLGVMGTIGSFGGMFDLSQLNYKEPVLVSGTDGVGTKLLLAIMMDKHDTIGQDVVAMCVNDVLAQGAEPLFFLDYVAVDKNRPERIEQIVKGVADGCEIAGCALIGGETAEMPDMYEENHYDIAGFTLGAVEKSKIIDGSKVAVGDSIIGIASSGVHSNGFSLVRKIILKDNDMNLNSHNDQLDGSIGETLLKPTKIYIKPVLNVLKEVNVKAIAHITGGGFDENIPRALKDGQGASITEGSWPILPIFKLLEELGNVNHREMYNIFNMGIGMVMIVSKDDESKVINILEENGEKAYPIGVVTKGNGVEIK